MDLLARVKYLTSDSNEMLGGECGGKFGQVGGKGSGGGGGGGAGAGSREVPQGDICRRRSKKRTPALNGCFKLSAEDESDLIQMLNDPASELFRLFAHHNPNKSPQQCYLDLKYSSPDDLESKSLYEKVLKYAQLHRKLGKRIKREKTVVVGKAAAAAVVDPLPASSKREKECEKEVVKVKCGDAAEKKKEKKMVIPKKGKAEDPGVVPFSQFLQEDGCNDRLKGKGSAAAAAAAGVGKQRAEKKQQDGPCANPLLFMAMKSGGQEVVEESEAEDAILKSYQKALVSKNMDTGMRLALLDGDSNRAVKGSGDGLAGCGLPSLLKGRRRSPPANRTGNCFVSRPMRANRIQHSLSSVSSIEVHKTNTTCSMSSTSISISTCEIEDCNNTVRNIMDKICSLETKKKACRSTAAVSPRDLSAIRKKQRGLLVEFTKERERQRRRLSQDNRNNNNNSNCDTFATLSPQRNPQYTEQDDLTQWTVPAAGSSSRSARINMDVDSCGLSASLFGNCAALKSFEKKSGMSIENLLKRRESDLAYRKQRAQELLKWHQRIAMEEDSVKELESQVMTRGSPRCGGSGGKVKAAGNCSSPRSSTCIQSITGCTRTCECSSCCPPPPACCDPCRCCDPCNCCDPCQCKCRDACACGCCATGAARCTGVGRPKKNRIVPENPPLCCKEKNCGGCCGERNYCSPTYCISGWTLNKLWRDISGLPCDKYNNCFEYNLTERDFEEFYAAAKRERKVMRLGLEECTRCPEFDREEVVKPKRQHLAWNSCDKMGETYGCRRGECEKDEEWSMMFSQPRHVELEEGAPMGRDSKEGEGEEELLIGNGDGGGEDEKKEKMVLECEDDHEEVVEMEKMVIRSGSLSLSPERREEDSSEMGSKVQEPLVVTELSSVDQKSGEEEEEEEIEIKNDESKEAVKIPLCLSPTLIDDQKKGGEGDNDSTSSSHTRWRGDLLSGVSGQVEEAEQAVLRNLPPVPLSYIVKEVPSAEKVLSMLQEKEQLIAWDLTNPYLRILSQEIPYLIEEAEEGNGERIRLENTIIDRLEQLRVYQLNLKRAHMGIEELVFEGPHYPHVQQIQDLVEYPQTEEESGRGGAAAVNGVQWSPPYEEKGQRKGEREEENEEEDCLYAAGESMQRRYGAVQSVETRDRSYEEDEGEYFDEEEDEFLDYYSDMQYLKQSEQQILAIFTDHIMNSMLDEVVAVVQRNFPQK